VFGSLAFMASAVSGSSPATVSIYIMTPQSIRRKK